MPPVTVLLPAAEPAVSDKLRPKWMLSGPKNELLLALALASLPSAAVGRVLVGVLQAHEERWKASSGVRRALGAGVETVVFEAPPGGPAETAAAMVARAGVAGPIVVKETDGWFAPPALPAGDFICVADLAAHPRLAGLAARIFVAPDGLRLAAGEPCSRLIAAGAWGFADAAAFADAVGGGFPGAAERLRAGGARFAVVPVEGFHDVGALPDWHAWRRRFRTLVVDIDGVVVRNRGPYFPPLWEEPDEPIAANVAHLKALAAEGAQLVFMTARPEAFRAKTEATLRSLGLSWHALVMGCHHAQRVIVNDYAPSNPHPSCEAVNLPRESPALPDLLPLESG
jgi:hypothetical protein